MLNLISWVFGIFKTPSFGVIYGALGRFVMSRFWLVISCWSMVNWGMVCNSMVNWSSMVDKSCWVMNRSSMVDRFRLVVRFRLMVRFRLVIDRGSVVDWFNGAIGWGGGVTIDWANWVVGVHCCRCY